MSEPIMETVSENTQAPRKRGRPRRIDDAARQMVEFVAGEIKTERGKQNVFYGMAFLKVLKDADAHRAIMGCTQEEMLAGLGKWPRGYSEAANEAGRCIMAGACDGAQAVEIMADARRRGFKFSQVAAHFRALRLGERQGNAQSLTVALARTVDRYRRQFPATTPEQVREAIQRLGDAVAGEDGEGELDGPTARARMGQGEVAHE